MMRPLSPLQGIIDAVPDGVVLVDRQHTVTLVNEIGQQRLLQLSGARLGETLTHLGGARWFRCWPETHLASETG